MPGIEIRAFSDDDLVAAGQLLARRHRRQRAVEPLLSARYEDTAAAQAEVEALWRRDGASGVLAARDGRAVGFLVGVPRDESWGANVWVEPAGHAVDEAEDLRDLYAAVAETWVEQSRTRHYALVPNDPALVDPWFRVGFGQQHAHGIREVEGPAQYPAGVRRAEERDLDAMVAMSPLISEHQALSPVFGPGPRDRDEADLRAELLADIADDEIGELVFERDGRVLGSLEVVPVERGSTHTSLARPDGAALLGWIATFPDVRGSGAGVALTEACFAWAFQRGYRTMVTDWRVTNLLSSRFWPRRGFRTSFLRLYRSIP
jgi:ribosomal protein S18 acetylase RimI-like enzyme